MIFGIGTDLTHIPRIKKTHDRWKERFLSRVFTENEVRFCQRRIHIIRCLAMRFAAKEAFSKALGTGMRDGIFWKDIEIWHDKRGKPGLRLYGNALKMVEKSKIQSMHLSLSDEGDYALAMVVLEC